MVDIENTFKNVFVTYKYKTTDEQLKYIVEKWIGKWILSYD